MGLEIAYSNISQQQADWLGQAAGSVDDVEHIPGSAEPWVSRLVHSFILAIGARTVLETGCFMGGTSVWILDALHQLGGGTFYLCDIEKARCDATDARLAAKGIPPVRVRDYPGDVLHFLKDTDARFDLAWVDDCHEKKHVERELTLLIPKMNAGGLILGHDVWGSCDLQETFGKFGGFSLNLPRLGAAGGMGIIQIPNPASHSVF